MDPANSLPSLQEPATGCFSEAAEFTLHPHCFQVPRSKNAWSYTSKPVRLHGVVLS